MVQSKKTKPAPTSDAAAILRQWYGDDVAARVDAAPPDVGTLVWNHQNAFEWIGSQHRPDLFDYYRVDGSASPASRDRAKMVAEAKGYTALPADAEVYMAGCRADNDVIMIRTLETAERHREAARIRVANERNGVYKGAQPLASETRLTWTDTRSAMDAPRSALEHK